MGLYVYICSAGHSGSTLLDLLLGSHSTAATVGEISHLSKNVALNTQCTCGVSVRSCKVWGEVLGLVGRELGVDLLKDPYALNMGYPRATIVVDRAHQNQRYLFKRKGLLALYYLKMRYGLDVLDPFLGSIDESVTHNFLIYDAVRKVLGADVIVDSSKEYLKGIAVYKKRPDKVRILLLTRDGRGVYYSNLKRKFSREHSVNSWKRHYARALPLLERHVDPNHILQVRYEDIAGNTAGEVSRICEFLGLEYEPEMLEFATHVHHSTNGNDMRFSNSSHISIDTSWRQKLTEAQVRYFEAKAGWLNRELGYE